MLYLTTDEQKIVDKITRKRELMKKPDAPKALYRTQIKRLTKILSEMYYKDHPDFPTLSRGNQGQG